MSHLVAASSNPTIVLSPQQKAVEKFVLAKKKESVLLVARAGCGKTTTLIEVAKSVKTKTDKTVFFGSFNKSIASEIDQRMRASGMLPPRFKASTMHSAGLNAWKSLYPRVKVDGSKVFNIAKEFVRGLNFRDSQMFGQFFGFYRKAISLAKSAGFGITCEVDDLKEWYALIDHFNLDYSLPEDVDMNAILHFTIQIFEESLRRNDTAVDFDDMIHAPLLKKVRFEQYDWVFIDEAQDLNVTRQMLAYNLCKPDGRMMFVGDPKQAIYAFTGADTHSMDNIRAKLNAEVLPLNVTRRCSQAVVRYAQAVVPDIVAHESNPEGQVGVMQWHDEKAPNYFWNETLTKEDVILCRKNKPLLEMAYKLLRRGIACRIEGKNIADDLVAMVKRWKKVTSIEELLDNMDAWSKKMYEKLVAKDEEMKAEDLMDRVETVRIIAERAMAEGAKTPDDLAKHITGMFGDTPEGQKPEVLVLSTVHKSKGREWTRVFNLGAKEFMPHPMAKKDWEKECEQNLLYVARTRAKLEYWELPAE